MLILTALIWGFGTVVVKETVSNVPPAWLVGIRFFFAGIVLAFAIMPRLVRTLDRAHLRIGALLGCILFGQYWLNSLGLTDTTASNSAFLTSCSCIIVPFLAWIMLRQPPTRFNIIAAILCILGIGLISLSSTSPLSLGFGDGVTLISALFIAFEVVIVAKSSRNYDVLTLTCIQFFVAGILGFGGALLVEPLPNFAHLSLTTWLALVYLAVCASCITIVLQNLGLSKVEPTQGSLLLSTEAVFGAVFAIIFLGEELTLSLFAGFTLIFAALVLSEYLPLKLEQRNTLP